MSICSLGKAELRAFLDSLSELRRSLHRHAELSGREKETPAIIREFIARFQPDETAAGLGGNGMAFCFNGRTAGPTVLFRAELDALPLNDASSLPHRSLDPAAAHKCGHDGHMAILAGLAGLLHRCRPRRGRVVLLFQPAEENGEGAAKVICDAGFKRFSPDAAFALHNLPGYETGKILLKEGTFTCASIGLRIRLIGKSAHASHPEQGQSPAKAMCRIIKRLSNLPADVERRCGYTLVTVVHARLGGEGFGTAPGKAEVLATLRAEKDADLERLKSLAMDTATRCARAGAVSCEFEWSDYFSAVVNDGAAVRAVARAADRAGSEVEWLAEPFRWSEDFGRFAVTAPASLFGLGAGEKTPPLHSPDYDFPDTLIDFGLKVFWYIVDELLMH